jgi:hypothetical protein
LGDCWFLSAVAVLTEMSRIAEVIITPAYNEEGIYTIRFCIQVFGILNLSLIPCEEICGFYFHEAIDRYIYAYM